MRRVVSLAAIVGFAIFGLPATGSADAIYTFESPEFTNGQTTPLLSIPPNAGPATFLTSFTDLVDANGFLITTVAENALMVGQALLEPTATSALTLTFNMPVTALSVNFAVDTGFSPAGLLKLVTSSGSATVTGGNVGGSFPGGTLDFITLTPFTTATLQGFTAAGAPTQIEIDNLSLTLAVPEPSTVALFGFGAGFLLVWYRRKARTAVSI